MIKPAHSFSFFLSFSISSLSLYFLSPLSFLPFSLPLPFLFLCFSSLPLFFPPSSSPSFLPSFVASFLPFSLSLCVKLFLCGGLPPSFALLTIPRKPVSSLSDIFPLSCLCHLDLENWCGGWGMGLERKTGLLHHWRLISVVKVLRLWNGQLVMIKILIRHWG